MLRPAGLVRLGQATVDVVSEGRYLPAGCQVRVTSVEGRRVVVVPVADAPERETAEGQSGPKEGGV
jgi:membrane-bound serine protease (ClpP class)